MNLISMLNIHDEKKERKNVRSNEAHTLNRDHGYSVYEALELNKNNQVRSSLGLQIQLLQDFNR